MQNDQDNDNPEIKDEPPTEHQASEQEEELPDRVDDILQKQLTELSATADSDETTVAVVAIVLKEEFVTEGNDLLPMSTAVGSDHDFDPGPPEVAEENEDAVMATAAAETSGADDNIPGLIEHVSDGEIEEDEEEGEVETEQRMSAEHTAELAKPTASQNKQQAHEAFVLALKSHAEGLGLNFIPQAGFFQILEKETGHKLYVSRSVRDSTPISIETTMELVGILPGAHAPKKENGKIAATLEAKLDLVIQALGILASKKLGKIRSSRRAVPANTATPK